MDRDTVGSAPLLLRGSHPRCSSCAASGP